MRFYCTEAAAPHHQGGDHDQPRPCRGGTSSGRTPTPRLLGRDLRGVKCRLPVVAVAVLIDTVPDDLARCGVHRRVGVVAVKGRAGDVAIGLVARAEGAALIDEAVAVDVNVPGGRIHGVVLVQEAVAIVVPFSVAHLVCVGVDRGEPIVAVAVRGLGPRQPRLVAGERAGARDI